MSDSKNGTARVENFTRFLIRWRWQVLVLSVIAALGVGFGASKIQLRTDYRVFFSKGNPELNAYESMQKIYSKEDNVMFVVTHPDEEVFSNTFLTAMKWLTDVAWKLPFTTRVDSITNFQNSRAEEDDLLVGDLVEDPESATAEDLAYFRDTAHSEPQLENRLVGQNPNVGALSAVMTLPIEDSEAAVTAAKAARDLRDRFLELYPDFDVHLTGIVMMNAAFGESSMSDMMFLIPIMYVGMIVTMYFVIRSISGTIGTVMVIILSSVAGMGMMGWLGIPLTPPSAIAPTVIMTLAVADSIHIIVSFLHYLREGHSKVDSIVESMRINFQPVFLTSLTTAVGFLSLNFSDAPPFRHLGNVVAIGVWAAWIFSIITLPAFLAIAKFNTREVADSRRAFLDGLAEKIIRNRARTMWASVAVVVSLAAFIPTIELNDQWVKYFGHRIEFRDDTDYAMENLTGIYTIEYSVESGESGGINNPEYLQNLDKFANWMRGLPEVKQVNSIADIMRRLNKNMHGDEEEWYRIPGERNLAAQYLLLFEMSLPYGLDLNNQINVDKSASRVILTTGNVTTKKMREMADTIYAWQQENLPEEMVTEATSPTVMFSHISERNIKSMLGGTTLAVFIISGILGITLRSLKYGVISLVPNLVPVILGFGTWAILVGEIGMSLSVVTGMTLGIVVDDTVHFLTKYLRARREKGLGSEDAVRYAFSTVGPAIVATTIILMIGFGILSFSSFALNSWMAQLTTIVIAFALLADLIFLPAFLITFDRHKSGKQIASSSKTNLETEPVIA